MSAAAGLVVYFALAIAAHVRADDTANLMMPVVMEILAASVLALQFALLET